MSKQPRREFLLALVCFFLLAFIPLWPMLKGDVFVPGGLLKNIRPWQNGEPQTWDVLRWDSVAQFYPWRKYLVTNLKAGEVPLWNRHELMGTPFLANSQSAVFYPVHWLLAPLGVNTLIDLSALLHLIWAGLGVYVLCRWLGCGFGAAVAAGLTFELSQWMITWLQLPSLPMTAAWIPWLLAAIHRVWTKPDFAGAVRTALCAGMMILAGHLQIGIYGLLAGSAYAVYLALASRKGRVLAWSLAGLAGGFCLAAVQFLPTYELGKLSHRANTPTEEGYGFYTRLAMPASYLSLGLNPYALGDPNKADDYEGAEALPEYASFVGIVPIFALLVPALYKRAGFFMGLWVAAWLLALGTIVNKLLYFGIPGWSSTGSPARVLCLAALAASVALAYLLEYVMEKRPKWRRVDYAGACIQMGLLAGFAFKFGLWSPPAEVYPSVSGVEALQKASPYRVAVINEKWGRKQPPPFAILPPNSALNYGFDEVGGYDSIILKSTKEQILDKMNGGDSAPVENGNMMFVKPPALANGSLEQLGVRYIVIPGELRDPGPLREVSTSDGMTIYQFPSLPPFVSLQAKDGRAWVCGFEWRGPNSFRIAPPKDAQPGIVTILVPAAPGWNFDNATATTHGPWLTATTNSKGSSIVARYEPDSYRAGLFLSLTALAVCCGCGGYQLARRRNGVT